MREETKIVGTSAPRKEGLGKVTGAARYIDDISFPNMWHGATVRSSIPRGRITGIHFAPHIPWHEFTIVTARDIPGKNRIALIMDHDQPVLADDLTNHPEEPIVLLAHPDKARLPAAVHAVRIEYDPLPAVFTIEESERQQTIVWGDDNIIKKFHMHKGDVDSVWPHAAHIIEGEYFTGAQEQLYIENNGVIATWDDNAEATLTIHGSMQCPFYVHKAMLSIFALPPEKVRVIQVETGGAFGGKEDYPSLIAAHAGLLSKKSGHPIKIIYDRMEDLAATTKRHPCRTRYRTAVDKDGHLLAMDIHVDTDAGAYATVSPTVLSRATIHSSGPYFCENVRVRSHAWATNLPPHGAFRGFGAPQSIFGIERHMDRIAHALNIPPAELRRRNFLAQGLATATNQIIKDPIDMPGMLDRVLSLSNYHAKRERFARENPSSPIKRGMGIASFMHGSGFTGSGERRLDSLVAIEADDQGKVTVLVSSTEFGQGTNTILSQVAAEALSIPYEDVNLAQPDTSRVPNSGPTVASRTAMIVGRLVHDSAKNLLALLREKNLLPDQNFTPQQFCVACNLYTSKFGQLRAEARYQAPKDIFWDDDKYQGEAYPAFAWAVYVAEVAVDTRTYSAEVVNFYALQEVGRVLNPVLAAGQIEGGVAQGIGYALYEKVVWKDGRMSNNQMTNYIMPTSADIPNIEVFFEEVPCVHGAYGSKGIGELPHDGPAPAILNAIHDATGVSFHSIPLLPEDIHLRLAMGSIELETAEPAQ